MQNSLTHLFFCSVHVLNASCTKFFFWPTIKNQRHYKCAGKYCLSLIFRLINWLKSNHNDNITFHLYGWYITIAWKQKLIEPKGATTKCLYLDFSYFTFAGGQQLISPMRQRMQTTVTCTWALLPSVTSKLFGVWADPRNPQLLQWTLLYTYSGHCNIQWYIQWDSSSVFDKINHVDF